MLTVESDLGRVRSALLLGISPEGAGTVVRPVFALRKSGVPAVDRLRVAAANWLYCGFLYRDVAIMDETHFRPHFVLPEDRVIHDYVRFLEGLPRASGSGAARPFVALG